MAMAFVQRLRPLRQLHSVTQMSWRLRSVASLGSTERLSQSIAVLRHPPSHMELPANLRELTFNASESRLLCDCILPGPQLGFTAEEPVQKPVMQALNTRKDFRRWKRRRKQDGGRNRHFRLKYG
ncbi:pis1 [Symbiodinium natans]|uniref:Pis1 protein n=1 Tax=Symbiodinium natans TaxID=878477 RepID=A0A812RK71_9DINO|nr:pis1 [Symbiodinium natans]